MHLVYEDTKEEILAVERKAKHQPPHLHQTMELVYVMKGSLELGVGLELFHMEEGDIGLIFPDVIHHCQVFQNSIVKCYILMYRQGHWVHMKNY